MSLRHPRIRALTVLALVAGLAGCASTASYPGSTPRTTVVVNNANSAMNAMTVHLLTPAGIRVPLGEVSLNESRAFTLRRDLRPGDYRLEARGARKVTSHAFRLDAGDVMEWDLRRNTVRFQGKTATR
jgi:hypothetical protein